MRAWLAEKQPVPPLQQRLIATWLHQPERDLFTDQAPAEEAGPEAAAPAPGSVTPTAVLEPG